MSNRKWRSAATLEDCVAVLLDRGADLLESTESVINTESSIIFNLRVWAAIRDVSDRLAKSNPWANALASYADYATSGMMARPAEGKGGLGALAHLDRHAAQFVLSGESLPAARERVVSLFGTARIPATTAFDEWLLDEVRGAAKQNTALN
jgi:hypothetical protein